jgi:hypothetical protein
LLQKFISLRLSPAPLSGLVFCILLLLIGLEAAAQEPFKIYGKFMVNDGSLNSGKIKVEKNGKQVSLVEAKKSKFEFALEYDCQYVFSYIKEGYVTKKVEVNTYVPKEKQSLEFEPFKFDVEIFKQYEGVNTVIYNQAVGKIKFNDVLNEFDYDTDYTKSIQSELARIEELLKQKAKEEAEKKAEKEKANAKLEAQRKEEEKKKNELALKSKSETEKSEAKTEGKIEPAKNEVKVSIKSEKNAEKNSSTVSRPTPPKPIAGSGMITMQAYTAAIYGYPQAKGYGWINYGDGTGIQEISTREEYESLEKQYGR